MEFLGIADIQYALLPVAAVLILALIVFAYGIRPGAAPELSFDKLSNENNFDDKKSGKRRSKPKDKKTENGQVASQANQQAASESKSEAKKAQSSKSSEKKPVAAPANKAKEVSKADNKKNAQLEVKTKKSAKKVNNNNEADRNQVPEGFDDAGWVQAVNKKDKKLRIKREDGDLKSDISSPDGTPLHKKNKTKIAAPAKRIEAVSAPVVQAAAAASTPVVEESKPAKVTPAAPIESEPAKVIPAAPVVSEPAKVIPAAPVVSEPASKPVAKPEPRQVTKEDKKKKKDKSTPAPAAPVAAAEESVAPTPVQTATPIVAQPAKEPEPVVLPSSEENSNVAFDELADVWQETKGQKKKKKARRD